MPPATEHVFGPVPSRRLGRSLGVDLIPFKTCPYDCVYCQLGRTTDCTLTRREFLPVAQVLEEVAAALADGGAPDYLTLAGSGEPTLYEPLDELLVGLKALSDVPVAVLTNGALLGLPEVRAALTKADLVVPSLDVGNETLFRTINRPHPELCFAGVAAGLLQFGEQFRGRLWLEVLLLGGEAADAASVRPLAALAARLQPERVQLGTVVRPPAEPWAQEATPEELSAAQRLLGDRCEIIADYHPTAALTLPRAGEQAVLELLRRRPCRLEDLAAGLALHRNAVVKHVGHLLRAGQIGVEHRGGEAYYTALRQTPCAPGATRIDS